ncbi:MAG: hypothetical protein U5Q44_10525 [Dehalococcoidia bacterium]|nr:hypothetical protein [Dehalococcoidia bacterium]
MGCIARSTTYHWDLCVDESLMYGELLEIKVTPLTQEAADMTFEVTVYQPGDFLGDDSGLEFPFGVGYTIDLQYGFDFFVDDPYPLGAYEIELEADYFPVTSVIVTYQVASPARHTRSSARWNPVRHWR